MVKPLVTFGSADVAILVLFVAALFALGFSAKLRSNTILQFLAAGRGLTLPLFVASLVSLWYGGILGIGESVSAYGIATWIFFGVPYYVFAIAYALWIAPRVRNASQLSIPERLELRFGKGAAAMGALLMFLLAVPAMHVLMLGTLLTAASGLPLTVAVPIGALIGASFLYRGGLLADARVSILGFLMMYVGFGVIVGYCLIHFPVGATLGSLPPTLLKWDAGKGILYVLSLFVLGAWTFVDPGFHQRVVSSTSAEVGRKGVLISTAFWLLFDILSITAALYAVALNPKATQLDVFPALAQMVLPAGLKALFFCGMLGTIISAMVGYSLVSGTTIGREIVGRLKPGLTEASLTLWSRIGVGIASLVAIVLALSLDSVVALWTSWAGAVIGAMLLPMLLAYKSKLLPRVRPATVWISMLLSFALAAGWMVFGRTHGNPDLEIRMEGMHITMPDARVTGVPQVDTNFAVGTLLPGLLVSALVIALGAAFARPREAV